MLSNLHLAVTSALVGLIWVIQMVKYPGFRYVPANDFKAYHRHHARSITWVVLPLMIAEVGLAAWLFFQNEFVWERLVPLFLVVDIWVSTFMVQVPMHNALSEKKDDEVIEKLIRSNWIRAILWTIEAVWLLFFVV